MKKAVGRSVARMTVRSCRADAKRPLFRHVHQRRDEVVSAQTLLRFALDQQRDLDRSLAAVA